MYMARITTGGTDRYVIRESIRSGPHWVCRDLVSLGRDPGRYIRYPGGRTYTIDSWVEDRLEQQGVRYDPERLAELFFPFLESRMRWQMAWACGRARRGGQSRIDPVDPERFHRFDKRRLLFLKFGAVNPRAVSRFPGVLLRALEAKSRDEIEQHFMAMEAGLPFSDQKRYVFQIFDLQCSFHQGFAGSAPWLLCQEEVDDRLVEAVCRLEEDAGFWAGMPAAGSPRPYLTRYVVMYFDGDYPQAAFPDAWIRDFINNRRQYRPPAGIRVKMDRAAELFQVDVDTLKRMGRVELTRLFRRRAQRLHPDKGGDQEHFVQLTEAYHKLLRKKR